MRSTETHVSNNKATKSKSLTNGLRILVGLTLGGRTGVLAVVGKLVREAVRSNGVRVDNGGTTTSNHGPDASLGVEDGKLQRSTGGAIELLDVRLLLGQITTEGSGPDLQTTWISARHAYVLLL